MPSPRKTASRRRGYKPQLDHDGDGRNGGSPPKGRSGARPSKPKAPPKVEAEAPPAPVEEAPAEAKASAVPPAAPERVRLGQALGLLHRVSLGVVLDLFGDDLKARVATLRTSQATLDQQERVRATEGRCAPVIFTAGGKGEAATLFAGAETVAAAINVGLDSVFVITVAAGDAGEAQTHLASQARAKPKGPDDDELLWRVNASDE